VCSSDLLDDRLGAILVAVYDLIGQALELPAARLFAAQTKSHIQQTWWSQCYPPALMASEAKRGADLGYRVHKVKARPWEDPIAQAEAICDVIPRDMRVWVDANAWWGSVGRTLHFAERLAKFENYFAIESPISRERIDGYRELKDFAKQLRDSLLRLDNVGKVAISGTQDERVFIEYNDARLAELKLSVSQIGQILQSRNILISGGGLLTGEERIELEPSGNFNSIEELAHTVISVPNRPDLLYLEDIAEITRGYVDPPRGLVWANGETALVLSVSVRAGGNVVTLGEEVREIGRASCRERV